MRISVLSIIICFVLLSTSCREDERIIPSTPNQVTPGVSGTSVKGFFLLNEGNMGSNKATLDYFDYETGIYHKNIYAERNPGVVQELGDVGNDIQIYGNKLYAIINCSHFVEVMNVETANTSRKFPYLIAVISSLKINMHTSVRMQALSK